MNGSKKKGCRGRTARRVARGGRAQASVAVDELGLPEVGEGEQLVWKPIEYVGAVMALAELNVLLEKPFEAMTADELEQVSRAAFTINFAQIEEKHRRKAS